MTSPLLSPFIEERLALIFPPSEQDEARTILAQCAQGTANFLSDANPERLQAAALKLSRGEISLLRVVVHDAVNVDFRDVLMPAEFGDPESYKSWTPEKKW